MMDRETDFLNTERLGKAVTALEEYVTRVAQPLADGSAQTELLSLRAENAALKATQTQVAGELDTLITRVAQKGVDAL